MIRSMMAATLLALAAAACGDTRDVTARQGEAGNDAPRSALPAAREAEAPGTGAPAATVPAGDTRIEITASINGREIQAQGLGACEHAADGSIYERPASLWTARYDGQENDEISHLSVTFWRERSGTESVTMALQAGADVHRIGTVEGGDKQGSGTAALEGNAAAGTLVVKGKSAEGAAVEVRAKCARFTTMVAEGG